VKELARRNAATLYQKLYELAGNEAPLQTTVESWVEAAKLLPPAVTH
jgi:hypothetical protein